jgi:hypothetical protein
MAKLDGSCLCGKVTYSCAVEPVAQAVCHCRDCQRQTGTSFSIIVGVPRDALQIDGDLASYTTVGEDTGKEVSRRFCPECGSPVMSVGEAWPEVAFIKAGTLHDTSWLEPQLHVWTDSAQPWVPLESLEAPKTPRGPTA